MAKTLTVLDRVENLEKQTVPWLLEKLESLSKMQQQSSTTLFELMAGVIKASGPEFEAKVEAEVLAARKRRLVEESERAKKVLDDLVANGTFVSSDVVTPDCVVVGREFDTTGEVLGAGRTQVEFNQFSQDAKDKLLSQGVGAVYEAKDGKFEVLEIYVPNPNPPVAATETPAEPAPVETSVEPKAE